MSSQELNDEVSQENQEDDYHSSSEEYIEPYITQAEIVDKILQSDLDMGQMLYFTLAKRFAKNILMTQRPGGNLTLKHLEMIGDLGCNLEEPIEQSSIGMTYLKYRLPQEHKNQMTINMRDYWSLEDQIVPEQQKNEVLEENFRIFQLLTQKFVYLSQEMITHLIETAEYQTFEKGHIIQQPMIDSLFFIVSKGSVEMLQNTTIVAEFHANECFGLQEFLHGSFNQKYVYKTKEETNLMILRRSTLNQMQIQDRENWLRVCQFESLKHCCICQSAKHFTDECYLVHYVIEKVMFMKIKNQNQDDQERTYLERQGERNRLQLTLEKLLQAQNRLLKKQQKYVNLICPNIDYETDAQAIEWKYTNKYKFKKSLQKDIEFMYLLQRNTLDSNELI